MNAAVPRIAPDWVAASVMVGDLVGVMLYCGQAEPTARHDRAACYPREKALAQWPGLWLAKVASDNVSYRVGFAEG